MKFTSFLHKKLADLLNDRRIVVWYDAKGDFKEFAAVFDAPNCEVLSAEASVLKTRRRADEVYRLVNESEDPLKREGYMLIYVPRGRGVTEDEKMRDPFEVYAIAGAAFGDTEDQKIESLARQAMPSKAEEISRLFREGNPDIALLDELEKTQRWPVLNEVFHTETPADVTALALCDTVKAEEVDSRPGCVAELLRLLEDAFGFKATSERRKWKTLRPKAAEYILISEFLFDLPNGSPEALSAVPRAGNDAKSTVYTACDRMRADLGLRETYIELAGTIEDSLHLSVLLAEDLNLGGRDTFPFEERRLLSSAVSHVVSGDAAAARMVIERQKHSIWRHDPQRSPAWTAIERATALIELCVLVLHGLSSKKELVGLIKAYTEGGWSNLDRASRLFEAALTACPDEDIIEPIIDPCRRRYREAAVQLQDNVLTAVQAEGWPPDGAPRQTRIFDDLVAPLLERREKTAFFMVDSLRYEMGRDLAEALAGTGRVEINYAAGTIPTVTGCGMAALMPGADGMLRLVAKDGGLVPALGTRLLKTSADRMRFLSEIYGDRFFETTLDEMLGSPKKIAANIKNAELFVVRTQDPDAVAENLGGWRARRYLSDVVGDIASAVRWLASQGFNHVVISADHGHMMLPEIPAGDVVQTPPGGWLENKRRCRLGSGLAGAAGTITLKASNLGIQGDVQDVCLPVGFRVFSEGEGYFHGGLSLQEAVVPVVVFQSGGEKQSTAGKPDIDILYRSDKFTSRVIGLKFRLRGDMFGTANRVRIESFDGPGTKAKIIGEAADCEARDEKTREVTLQAGKETPVPILIDPDFDGPELEIRVSDPETRVVWAKLKLKNAMLD
ncbi:alkaline phosphatase [Dehalococcoides mccartyi]|jgi:PglZ domain.|uniref:PglZ domain-containing protein n=1 Tax=Dehalococcoides mccartyi TaxID=61435 RepID=UPI0002B75E12|nr:PglZ domain-containing protein [Dehalococcoides mccartyi]AGG07401.1 PglZ domain-containing protein [Dehalococcoides mccartyi BTF08]AQW61772.1 alkaline phosphatase [Dehalococcoides mccartyi]AQY72729.1 alkaline phosphatase [Dehalococcoides mccartyi]POZ58456.1 putative cytoplasmic protein [Dehalococcoides mccartyi]